MSERTGGSSAPGWYPDPSGAPGTRWWDGARWTDQVAAPVEGMWPMRPHSQVTAPVEGMWPMQPSRSVAGPPAAPAQKPKTWLRVLAVVTLLVILLVGGRTLVTWLTNKGDNWDGREVFVEKEVKIKSCEAVGGGFFFQAAGTLKNGSAKKANYSIDVLFFDKAGSQNGDGSTSVVNVGPGKTAKWDVTTNGLEPGTTCAILSASRVAAR